MGAPKIIEYKGETRTVKEWANHLNISVKTIFGRLRKGLPISKVLAKPYKQSSPYLTHNGEKLRVSEWSKKVEIHELTLLTRIKQGWCTEDVLFKPVRINMLMISHNGEKKTISEWSSITGVSRSSIYKRIFKDKLSFEEAIKIPTREAMSQHKNSILRGIESWQDVMRSYFTKEHRIKCYKKLKSDYEDIKREAMTRAA